MDAFRHGEINSLRPRQNRLYFADGIFKWIFLNENAGISLKIWLKFVLKLQINNIPALVLIMAWCRPGDMPLSEPMMGSLPTHIWVTRPQWVNQTWYRPSALESPTMTSSTKFEVNWISSLSANAQKLLNKYNRPGNGVNSLEYDQSQSAWQVP